MGTDKRDRQKANKAVKQAEQQKQARRQALIRSIVRATVLFAIAIVVFFIITLARGDDAPADTTTTTVAEASDTDGDAAADGPAAWAAFADLPTACGADAPSEPPTDETWDEPEDLGLEGPVTAELVTSCGTITMELDPTLAPESVNSFVFLAEQGYYDRQAFHRSVPTFVVQGGDPTATGTGGPGYTIADEFPEIGTAYPRGTVAMAHSPAPDSTGSQFFIVYTDDGASHLGSDDTLLFNVLGEVTDGLDVLDAIAAVPVEGQTPTEGIFIETVRIDR